MKAIFVLLALLLSGCTDKPTRQTDSMKAPQEKERYQGNGADLPAPFAADRHMRSQIKAQKEQAKKRRELMNQAAGR